MHPWEIKTGILIAVGVTFLSGVLATLVIQGVLRWLL